MYRSLKLASEIIGVAFTLAALTSTATVGPGSAGSGAGASGGAGGATPAAQPPSSDLIRPLEPRPAWEAVAGQQGSAAGERQGSAARPAMAKDDSDPLMAPWPDPLQPHP